MPVNVTVTKRELKNKTGVDVTVTSYDPAPSPKHVKNYHVVVITNLPFFKLPQHSDTDVVHFMVRRDYAAFEKFQRDIMVAFPELKLPSLPRKYHVFMSETDLEERMVSFDCVMKVIARHKTMCTSPPMLEFLGFSVISDRNYFKARREYLHKKEEDAVDKNREKDEVYGDRLKEIDQGLFGTVSSEEPFSDDSQTRSQPFTADSIFEEDGGKEKQVHKSAKISVLKEEERDLFIPGGEKQDEHSQENQSSLLNELEDNSELLNVTDSLDDVLKIADKKKAPLPKKVSPLLSSGGRGLFDLEESKDGVGMEGGDIMKYIQQNMDATNDDDLELF